MRHQIEDDFVGTLELVRDLGFDGVEMCSPQGNYYRTAGYGNLTDVPPEEIKQQIEDAGLFCRTSHFEAHEVLEDDVARTADYAAALGLQDIVMSGSTFGDDGTADEIMRWGERCNEAAQVVQAAGLRLGYHNHQVGPMVDGTPQYERIMDALDPALVTMQFQIASITGGYDPVYYLEKYAGRYSSLHIADYDPAFKSTRRPGRLGAIVAVGEGMVDWAELLRASLKSDMVDHGFIIEMETQEPLEDLRKSIAHLRSVTV
jgi:sugar phosphate isomerase/epimerase